MPTLRRYLENIYGPAPGFPPILHQKDDSDHDLTLPPSPPASAADKTPYRLSRSPCPQVISSEVEPLSHAVNDTESDTEVEDNAEVEAFYLAKSLDSERDVGTIFGKGIRIWQSHEGTAYTYIEGEIVNGEAMMPRKRKRLQQQTASSKATTPPAPTASLRARNPAQISTIFHRGSAAIGPLGAHARPLPLFRQTSRAAALTLPPKKRRGMVSGSFGTFEGALDRFDERPYQLLPSRTLSEREQRERKGPGRGLASNERPWLNRSGMEGA